MIPTNGQGSSDEEGKRYVLKNITANWVWENGDNVFFFVTAIFLLFEGMLWVLLNDKGSATVHHTHIRRAVTISCVIIVRSLKMLILFSS